MTHDVVAVSAPGKVLLAGGYLVLDRKHTGLVFGLDARIHVHVKPVSSSSGVAFSEITVRSPQFQDAVWEYGYRWSDGQGGMQVTQLRADADLKLNKNPFIETALAYTLSYISTVFNPVIAPSSITILADNDYYSTSSATIDPNERFHDFGLPLSKANKTGLGSSAALVTAFTAALLVFYLPKEKFDVSSSTSQRLLHNLAQAAHCAAQGKVGSGFDIASAVYGNCLYRRFSPSILSNHGDPGNKGFATRLRDLVDEVGTTGPWDTEISKDAIKVPKSLRLIMCDVSCGSQTPGMVKQVLAWRSEKPQEADKVWAELQEANEALAKELTRIAESDSRDFDALRQRILDIRAGIRDMSQKSGVPIEPPAQTQLLDACSEVKGVAGGVVPGAGGYDAVALLVENNQQVIEDLEKLLKDWKVKDSDDDGPGTGKVSTLRVREEVQGVRAEGTSSYVKWVQ